MRYFIILFISIISNLGISQHDIDLQVAIGVMEHGSDLHSWGRHGQMITDEAKLAFSLGAHIKINDHFGLRPNILCGSIQGDDKNINNHYEQGHDERGYSFKSPVIETSALGVYHIMNQEDIRSADSYKASISPYLIAGIGVSYTDPEVDFNNDDRKWRVKNDIEKMRRWNFQIPCGFGIEYNLNEDYFLQFEARSVLPLGDYLDGVSESANPDRNDSYQFLSAALGFRLNGEVRDADGDGVTDVNDKCPNEYGSKLFRGCPDTDGDGIKDSEDQCPNDYGSRILFGCPDSDSDGYADRNDKCPNIPGQTDGCPDADGDGIIDSLDECPQVLGFARFNGCPSDKKSLPKLESLPEKLDTPLSASPKEVKKGIEAEVIKEAIKNKSETQKVKEAPSETIKTDTKKVIIPTTKSAVINQNKKTTNPYLSEDIVIRNYKVDDLYFETNDDQIMESQQQKISEIALFADAHPRANFEIIGFADGRSNAEYNLQLSEKRAKQIYLSLIKKGVSSRRLFYRAEGETQPKGNNNTESGRQINRRVEVHGFLKG